MKSHFSLNQFRMLNECPAKWWAYVTEQSTPRPPTDAMLQGLLFEGELGLGDGIPEEYDGRQWDSRAKEPRRKKDFAAVTAVAEKVRALDVMRLLEGESQVQLEGEICGLRWRGVLDVVSDQHFADLKYTAQFGEYWSAHHRRRVPFYGAYELQLAVYRELLLQNFDRAGSAADAYVVAVGSRPPHPVVPVRFSTLPTSAELLDNIWSQGRLPQAAPWSQVAEELAEWREDDTPPPLSPCGVCEWCAKQEPQIIEAAI
tara:strand:+ start:6346 stop:7119 length:774 start_codon:yes stop_codon:yes gene_type:complete